MTKLYDNYPAYFAGLIDGEGCIMLKRQMHEEQGPYFGITIAINMTDKEPLELLQSLYGGALATVDRNPGVHKLVYRWGINADNCLRLLRDIHPYSIVKRAQVAMAIEFLCDEELTEEDKEIYFKVFRLLNHRGEDGRQEARDKIREVYSA